MPSDTKAANITPLAPSARPPQTKYEKLIAAAKQVPAATTVVAHPCDESSLRGAVEAAELGIIVPILVGSAAKIAAVAKQHGVDIAHHLRRQGRVLRAHIGVVGRD